jgi:hypothetical protein
LISLSRTCKLTGLHNFIILKNLEVLTTAPCF